MASAAVRAAWVSWRVRARASACELDTHGMAAAAAAKRSGVGIDPGEEMRSWTEVMGLNDVVVPRGEHSSSPPGSEGKAH